MKYLEKYPKQKLHLQIFKLIKRQSNIQQTFCSAFSICKISWELFNLKLIKDMHWMQYIIFDVSCLPSILVHLSVNIDLKELH